VPPDTFGLSDRRRLKGHRMSRLGERVVLLRLFYGGEMRKCVVGRGGFSISVCFSTTPTGTMSSRSCLRQYRAAAPDAPQPPGRRSVSGSARCKTRGALLFVSLCGGHSLARIRDDPVLKQRYQELALEFAHK
jgi:hypothetical protein